MWHILVLHEGYSEYFNLFVILHYFVDNGQYFMRDCCMLFNPANEAIPDSLDFVHFK